MEKKQMTLVYYYVPEDNDDPQYPNVFGIMVPKSKLTLTNIQQNFPLSGTYIFRFKANYGGNIVWVDFHHKNQKLPLFQERVVVKATRVSWESRSLSEFVNSPAVVVNGSSNGIGQKKDAKITKVDTKAKEAKPEGTKVKSESNGTNLIFGDSPKKSAQKDDGDLMNSLLGTDKNPNGSKETAKDPNLDFGDIVL